MNRTIEVIISPQGETTVQTKGFAGMDVEVDAVDSRERGEALAQSPRRYQRTRSRNHQGIVATIEGQTTVSREGGVAKAPEAATTIPHGRGGIETCAGPETTRARSSHLFMALIVRTELV